MCYVVLMKLSPNTMSAAVISKIILTVDSKFESLFGQRSSAVSDPHCGTNCHRPYNVQI